MSVEEEIDEIEGIGEAMGVKEVCSVKMQKVTGATHCCRYSQARIRSLNAKTCSGTAKSDQLNQ